MKLTSTISANEFKVVIYLALLAVVFFVCKEGIEMFLSWASGSFQSGFTTPVR